MLSFILKVVLISTSGALAPGPLTAATAASGAKHRWKGGFWISVGHTAVELPLVILIAFGVATVLTRQDIAAILSFLGGAMLLFFSYLTAKSAFEVKSLGGNGRSTSPFLTGLGLTAFNPFFIAWWAGIGASLIREALSIWGFAGLAILYTSHVWLDFVWLILLAHVTSLSSFSLRIYKSLLLILALLVALFGVDFIYFSITASHLLF
ncbi:MULTISPECIES: LysE family transporter [unclassified Archaeoglobus]|jgi:threonine/homoserine/homoserine lactone efflux protein|uniref:LysE family transporter n=1 Tax=unclassified Archaeoglobus TaxID=2643606 RepID=UPI0025C5A05A|nr:MULTISPECIES: LysE family transporter [unclassified Archaeoglobus]